MEKKNIIIEIEHASGVQKSFESFTAGTSSFTASAAGIVNLPKLKIDTSFGIVQIPSSKKVDPFNMDVNSEEPLHERFFSNDITVDMEPKSSTYIVRAEVDKKDLDAVVEDLNKQENVKGVFADVEIAPLLVCAGSAPVGTHLDVERLLCVPKMKSCKMTGKGVNVAIVDTGINMAYLNSHGKNPSINLPWSWKPATSSNQLGSAPVSHGTMCAFDVCIAAPQCTLLDIALLSTGATGPTPMSGVLSDAILAYSHLIRFMGRPLMPGENRSLVVNNSWGMFNPSWDFPVGHPGNYSSNPNHPFNRIVGTLAGLGADILFAAGNCGSECPDGRCQGVTNQGIYGANSHPSVTTVVGIATNLDRVGYSNRGPGRLFTNKPDVTGYTHFSGSGVYAADGGTSAATPVVAGVVAAIRTIRPLNNTVARRPAAIRNILTSTARDLGVAGYDFTYGFGLVDGCKIAKKLCPLPPICVRFPFICEFLNDRPRFIDYCRRNPGACILLKREIPNLPPDIDPEIIKYIKSSQFKSEIEMESMEELEDNLGSLEHNDEHSDCNCKSK